MTPLDPHDQALWVWLSVTTCAGHDSGSGNDSFAYLMTQIDLWWTTWLVATHDDSVQLMLTLIVVPKGLMTQDDLLWL